MNLRAVLVLGKRLLGLGTISGSAPDFWPLLVHREWSSVFGRIEQVFSVVYRISVDYY